MYFVLNPNANQIIKYAENCRTLGFKEFVVFTYHIIMVQSTVYQENKVKELI